jgi:uncharacterized low-complexity protein
MPLLAASTPTPLLVSVHHHQANPRSTAKIRQRRSCAVAEHALGGSDGETVRCAAGRRRLPLATAVRRNEIASSGSCGEPKGSASGRVGDDGCAATLLRAAKREAWRCSTLLPAGETWPSQAGQDVWVLEALQLLRGGFFVEVRSDPSFYVS